MNSAYHTDRNSTLYKLAGTKSFRLGSSKFYDGRGSNLQNQNKKSKAIYSSDKNKILVNVDQAGAEAVIVAYIAPSGRYRKLVECGVKSHIYVALNLFQEVWEAHLGRSIQEFLESPIENLTMLAGWKELSNLIQESDSWPAAKRYYFIAKMVSHCHDDKTEALTLEGWKLMKYIQPNEKIATWDVNKNITFEIPEKWNINDYKGDMYVISGNQISQCITPNHKIPYYTNGKLHIKEAKDFNVKQSNLPLCGFLQNKGIYLSTAEITLIAAIQADGYIEPKYGKSVRFHLAKHRKIERLENALVLLNICYSKYITVQGTTSISFKHTDIIQWFSLNYDDTKLWKDRKVFGSWLLTWQRNCLEQLIKELRYWDGSLCEGYQHKRNQYDSFKKENLDWIKTILHLIGKQGTINNTSLGINERQYSRFNPKYKYKKIYKGKVYCPTTQTGYFMVRRNGLISVSHNSSNYDIKAPTFCLNVLQKSQGTVALGLKDGKRFLEMYRKELFPEIPQWHLLVQSKLREGRELFNLQGYRRYFSGKWDAAMFRDAYSFVPQSTVGTITNIAVTKLQEYIEKENREWDILNNCHDSYLAQCPLGEKKELAKKMMEFMEVDLVGLRGVKFRMGASAECGFVWSEMKGLEI